MSDVVLDLRDGRGRFFTRVKLPERTYRELDVIRRLEGLTWDELIHRALSEYFERADA